MVKKIVGLLLTIGLSMGASADPNVVLTVTENGASKNYTMENLESLPQQEIKTKTPWHKGVVTFTGPLISSVLSKNTLEKTVSLEAIALNDYKTELPVSDIKQWNPILAIRIDGKPMHIREKGPIFIIYPYASSAELRSAIYYDRSIWQLRYIHTK